MSTANTATLYLGLSHQKAARKGTFSFVRCDYLLQLIAYSSGHCTLEKDPEKPLAYTLTAGKLPSIVQGLKTDQACKIAQSVVLDNKDICKLGQYVLVQSQDHSTFVAQVEEIVQVKGSDNELLGMPDGVLL